MDSQNLNQQKYTLLIFFAGIYGNEKDPKSHWGFIYFIYRWDGLPKNFIISIKCSELDLALKRGYWVTVYTKIHPADHMSICVLYSVSPKISYGALYEREQIYDILG